MHIFENYMRLVVWEEATGQLREVKSTDGVCLAKIGPVDVVLPEEVGENIKDLIGHRIGILRTDNGYRLRIVSAVLNNSI